MRFLVNPSTDPYFNMAFDEYCLTQYSLPGPVFYLWRNRPSVIIGLNQNAFSEVNLEYLENNGILLARRVTGGGAVYHDLQNLNYSIIGRSVSPQPVVDALRMMGVAAELTGRNDIFVDGRKVSGYARRVWQDRELIHGTLMYDVDMDALTQALNVPGSKMDAKGIASIHSRVANLKDYLPGSASVTDFAGRLHALLAGYNTHIISGHMHYNLNICFSDRLMEHNTAAVCGTWWCTDVCLDGTPVGYGIYKADGDELTWTYKSSGKPVSHQARVYMPGSSDEYPEALIANVWNWDPAWKVEWLEDGKVMGEMERFTGYDPYASALCKDRSIIKYDWIGPTVTEHLFKAVPSRPDARLNVRVTDRFGNVYDF